MKLFSWTVFFGLLIAPLMSVGCREKQKVDVMSLDWNSNFNSNRFVVLTDRWEYAERAWMKLRVSQDSSTNFNLNQWLEFQVEILTKTQNDPLKEEVRIMAAQEFGHHPEASYSYLAWLKDGLTQKLFKEPKVEQKVRDVVFKLESSQLSSASQHTNSPRQP